MAQPLKHPQSESGRKRAAEEERPLRQLFHGACRSSDAGTAVSFSTVESSMYKRCRILRAVVPRCLAVVLQALVSRLSTEAKWPWATTTQVWFSRATANSSYFARRLSCTSRLDIPRCAVVISSAVHDFCPSRGAHVSRLFCTCVTENDCTLRGGASSSSWAGAVVPQFQTSNHPKSSLISRKPLRQLFVLPSVTTWSYQVVDFTSRKHSWSVCASWARWTHTETTLPRQTLFRCLPGFHFCRSTKWGLDLKTWGRCWMTSRLLVTDANDISLVRWISVTQTHRKKFRPVSK